MLRKTAILILSSLGLAFTTGCSYGIFSPFAPFANFAGGVADVVEFFNIIFRTLGLGFQI